MGGFTVNEKQIQEAYNELNFSYKQNTFSYRLTDEVTKELDIPAYRNKKERCWLKYDVISVSAKKSIILTSWNFAFLTDELKTKFIQLVRYTMKVGHFVYVPTEDGLGLKKIEDDIIFGYLLDKRIGIYSKNYIILSFIIHNNRIFSVNLSENYHLLNSTVDNIFVEDLKTFTIIWKKDLLHYTQVNRYGSYTVPYGANLR